MEIDEWDKPVSETSIKSLANLIKKLTEIREEISKEEDRLDDLKAGRAILESNILTIMKEECLPSFKSEYGVVYIKNNKTITQPEDMEHKLEFFEYLKTQGIFESMISVNSRTLSSWASKEIESRESQGEFGWIPPGLKPAKEFQSLSFRKK